MDHRIYSRSLPEAKENLDVIPKIIEELARRLLEAAQGKMFPVDILTIAVLNRTVGNYAGFKSLVEGQNISAAGSILRTQIDSLIRYNALWLVEDPHDFSNNIIAGDRVDKIRDKNNKFLKDAYLVSQLSVDHPWLPQVYKNLCGFIHFSGGHVTDAVDKIEDNTITFRIGPQASRPDETWIELLDCFSETTRMLCDLVLGWIETKDLVDKNLF